MNLYFYEVNLAGGVLSLFVREAKTEIRRQGFGAGLFWDGSGNLQSGAGSW